MDIVSLNLIVIQMCILFTNSNRFYTDDMYQVE